MSRVNRRVRVLGAGIAALLLPTVPVVGAVAADPNGSTVTETFTQHGTWVEQNGTNFCTGAPITPTLTGNSVEHVTFFTGSSEIWMTFTSAVSIQKTDAAGLDWSGRATLWGNANVNEQNSNSTFTGTIRLYATDAQGVVHDQVGHVTAHTSWDAVAQQPVVDFVQVTVTCT